MTGRRPSLVSISMMSGRGIGLGCRSEGLVDALAALDPPVSLFSVEQDER